MLNVRLSSQWEVPTSTVLHLPHLESLSYNCQPQAELLNMQNNVYVTKTVTLSSIFNFEYFIATSIKYITKGLDQMHNCILRVFTLKYYKIHKYN